MMRLELILQEAGLRYTRYPLADSSFEYQVKVPGISMTKDFSWVDISNLCSAWCEEFIEEMSHWDSTRRSEERFKFDTVAPDVMRVVELIAISAGYGVLISRASDDRDPKFSDVYTAHILKDNFAGGQSWTKGMVHYSGTVHCVKVPSGKVLVKRNRCTMVSGNSGDPVKIVCGDPDAPFGSPAYKGAVECLDEIFGHEVSPQGYKILNPKVGVIYGDSITLERAVAIIKGLMAKGYASTNIVFGIGSFTYQMVSRDTFSIATKATWARRLDGSVFNLAKDPITDPGKKSATGYLSVRGRKEYSRIENDPNLIIKPAGEFYTDLELVENVDDRTEDNILNVMLRNSVVAESPYWSDITDRISAQARLQGCDLEALGIF